MDVVDASTGDADAGGGGTDADPLCGWSYTPGNFDPCMAGTPQPPLVLDGGLFVFTPATGDLTKDAAPHATLTTTGTTVRVLALEGLTITSTASLTIAGAEPLVIAVLGDASVAGGVSVSAVGRLPGAGAANCAAMAGMNADSNQTKSAGGGGAGGGYGSIGAAGGYGDTSIATKSLGGTAMSVQGNPGLDPLRGGCAGGAGGEEHDTAVAVPGFGGGGGGAIQISVNGMFSIGSAARIQAGGGGGGGAVSTANGPGTHAGAGGGGGGSGGSIRLEGGTMLIDPAARLCANGGGGGGGSHDLGGGATGAPGSDAACELAAAAGGPGSTSGGAGAFGATDGVEGENGGGADGGGSGGGGGVGRIRVRAVMGTSPSGFVSTPPAMID